MAKSATKKKTEDKKPTGKAVATRNGASNVPAHMRDYKSAGRGTSTDAHDNVIPMGRILQKMSPEVEKKSPQYINGAEPGDIYIKNLPNPIIKGEEGFLFQPVHYRWGFVEWVLRAKGGGGGSGFVAFYAPDKKPNDTTMQPDPNNPERMIEVRKNGNMLVETRYHSGYLIPEDESEAPMPLVLPFSGSGHSVSKNWMGMLNRKQIDGVKADSWCCYYRLKSVFKTKGNNSWHMFEVADGALDENENPETMWAPTVEDLKRGEELFVALESGTKKIDESAGGPDNESASTNRSSQGRM